MNDKFVILQELPAIVEQCRARGQRIVFTNGCFDLLHVGHVRSLQAARRLGEILIVGLNSDISVSQLKGPQRPIVSENQRGEVLAALTCVDYVVVFSEPDPLRVITAVQPDVLVKSTDWDPKEIIGREVVEARGGSVLSVPEVTGISTTILIERMRTAL
ncbi:MAG: D-glycero-beta-D-manno-heptose 1-phosphate adenylyltransferase [Nitrospiraceae bacterium]|nr:D-glycero-beta-D-manno-heptose 1-phosphate adenylyltransferase [Nitrospiraceae bacterium]|tara:strand:- start:492 stop:968 length:477 start_codon:yes stop_codon:yes gene_type:complete